MKNIPVIITSAAQKLFWQKKQPSFSTLLKKAVGKDALEARRLVSIDDLSDKDIELLFRTTYAFKYFYLQKSEKKLSFLSGKRIINLFIEESTRTRSSFELAGKQQGADVINVSGSSSSMAKKGESFADTVRTLKRMEADCIIIRDSHSMAPAMMAAEMDMPVINAGDGWHEHPTQGLLDAFTIAEEFGDVKGKVVAIIGDIVHSRVAGSQVRILKRLGADIRFVGPETLMPRDAEKEFGIKIFTDMEEGIKDADVLSVLRVQVERAAGAYIPTIRDYSKLYCVNTARLPLAHPDAIVIHPGPINREVDLTTEIMEGSHSRVEDQVTNGLAMRMALLYLLLKS